MMYKYEALSLTFQEEYKSRLLCHDWLAVVAVYNLQRLIGRAFLGQCLTH